MTSDQSHLKDQLPGWKALVASILLPMLSLAVVIGYGLVFGEEARAIEDQAIRSDTEGALDPPDQWSCDRIFPEYKAFLDAGNAPEDWPHLDKFYRNVRDGEIYTWRRWLRWANENKCGDGASLVEPEMGPGSLIGIAITEFGIIGAAATQRPKSPG